MLRDSVENPLISEKQWLNGHKAGECHPYIFFRAPWCWWDLPDNVDQLHTTFIYVDPDQMDVYICEIPASYVGTQEEKNRAWFVEEEEMLKRQCAAANRARGGGNVYAFHVVCNMETARPEIRSVEECIRLSVGNCANYDGSSHMAQDSSLGQVLA